jgi:exopolyphosphatase/guanosine-5'-triphosphate,3'-diphosphate pyrophosphatase
MPEVVTTARAAVREILAERGAGDYARRGRLVGVAGTITTIAALDAGLISYDHDVVHGYTLSAAAVRSWSERLNAMTVDEVKALGPVAPGRADVIGAGALVLACVTSVLGAPDLIVSELDILDGLVADLVG